MKNTLSRKALTGSNDSLFKFYLFPSLIESSSKIINPNLAFIDAKVLRKDSNEQTITNY